MINCYSIPFNDPRVIGLFSTRHCGNMSLDYSHTAVAVKNRMALLGKDYSKLACGKQAQGAEIHYVLAKEAGSGAVTRDAAFSNIDALVTDQLEIPLGVFSADCLSIFLFDPQKPAIGIVHAGWRGTSKNITTRTVDIMGYRFGSKPGQLKAAFGPCIRKCCYRVSPDFEEMFPRSVTLKDNSVFFDLALENKEQLLKCGIREENIQDSKICTSCDNANFFSYRKEGSNCGRIISVIKLKRPS